MNHHLQLLAIIPYLIASLTVAKQTFNNSGQQTSNNNKSYGAPCGPLSQQVHVSGYGLHQTLNLFTSFHHLYRSALLNYYWCQS